MQGIWTFVWVLLHWCEGAERTEQSPEARVGMKKWRFGTRSSSSCQHIPPKSHAGPEHYICPKPRPEPRPEQSPNCRNEPRCWHSGPIPKLCCASRCHLRPLLEKVVWMWMAPQMVPNLTKIQFNGFPTWQWSESNIHLAETVLRILNCDLLLGYRYVVRYFSMILAGHTHDYKGE